MDQSWKTVRIFISSTFRDMHAERDHLVRMVFPELKARCRSKHIQLIDVDLRWGVTEKEAESGKALDICLDEIDSCRPYFLGLLGHRYGWIPAGHQHSITAQEVYHGVLHGNMPNQIVDLRKILEEKLEGVSLTNEQKNTLTRCYPWDPAKNKYVLAEAVADEEKEIIKSVFQRYSIYQRDRSFFFFRTEALSRQLAGTNGEDFFESSVDNQQKLAALKKDISDERLPHFEYNDLETFGQLVQDILWKRIEAEAEVLTVEKDWLQQEAEFHELFMADRTRRFVGRRDLLDRTHDFCTRDDEPSILLVTGEPGYGKSAVMARFTEEALQKHADWLVIPHFVGASPASTNLRRILYRFCTQLNRAIGSTEETPEDIKELLKLFPELLAKAAGNRKLLFIIDAANQLEKADDAHRMYWLPQQLPANVRFVISTLEGEAKDALLARLIKPHVEPLGGLSPSEIRELVKAYLTEIRHEFPNPQVEAEFFSKVERGNPLYILVALEELRVFGKFEELGNKISKLPDNVPDLFDQVLERIESDFNRPLVRDCMSYIACGRHGMTAEELQTLLKQHAPRLDPNSEPVKLPDLLWNRFYRSFSSYLFERSGVIDFFHGQLKEAVGKRYLTNEGDRKAAHKIIAEYFEKRWQEPYLRALDELPYQRTKAADWLPLRNLLCSIEFLETKCSVTSVYEIIRDIQFSLDQAPVDQEVRPELLAVNTVLDAYSQAFMEHPQILLQQFYNSLVWDWGATTYLGMKLREAAGSTRRPWLRQLKAPAPLDSDPSLIRSIQVRSFSVAFSPDGRTVATGDYDAEISLWDVQTGERLRTLKGHSSYVWSVSFARKVNLLVSTDGRLILIWNPDTGIILHSIKRSMEREFPGRVAFSPDGELVAAGYQDGTIRLWSAQTADMLLEWAAHPGTDITNDVEFLVFSHDGKFLTSCGKDRFIRIWDAKTGDLLREFQGHTSFVKSVAVSSDGSLVASASWDGTVKIWDIRKGELKQNLSLTERDYIQSVAFSSDSLWVACSSHDHRDQIVQVMLWETETWKPIRIFQGGGDAVAFSPDSLILASAGYGLQFWDLRKVDSQFSGSSSQRKEGVGTMIFSPDAFVAITSCGQKYSEYLSDDKTISCWDTESGQLIRVLNENQEFQAAVAFAFSSDGKILASAHPEDQIALWDVGTGALLKSWRSEKGCLSLAFSPDGSVLASGCYEKRIDVWDFRNGELQAAFYAAGGETQMSPVTALAFSSDGNLLASALEYGPMTLWNFQPIGVKQVLDVKGVGIDSIAFSPDGSVLVCGGKGIYLWTKDFLEPQIVPFDSVETLIFNQDGKILAAMNPRALALYSSPAMEFKAFLPYSGIGAIWLDAKEPCVKVGHGNVFDKLRAENL